MPSTSAALISNPSLQGVDQTKDWYIAVQTKGGGEPAVVFGIPVTNADMAKQGLGEGFKSKAHGSWLFYSEDEAAFRRRRRLPPQSKQP